MKKEDAPFQLWIKDVAPSNTLRQWFGHAPERWPEFRKQYETELSANLSALQPLLDIARQGPLTLLYAAHDETHNNAVVLADYLPPAFQSLAAGKCGTGCQHATHDVSAPVRKHPGPLPPQRRCNDVPCKTRPICRQPSLLTEALPLRKQATPQRGTGAY